MASLDPHTVSNVSLIKPKYAKTIETLINGFDSIDESKNRFIL